jgi:hypothetical protein
VTDFPTKLRLKALAEEDIYFAKRDRELINALHERRLAKHLKLESNRKKKKAQLLERRYARVSAEHRDRPRKLGRRYRKLVDKALKLIRRKGR